MAVTLSRKTADGKLAVKKNNMTATSGEGKELSLPNRPDYHPPLLLLLHRRSSAARFHEGSGLHSSGCKNRFLPGAIENYKVEENFAGPHGDIEQTTLSVGCLALLLPNALRTPHSSATSLPSPGVEKVPGKTRCHPSPHYHGGAAEGAEEERNANTRRTGNRKSKNKSRPKV